MTSAPVETHSDLARVFATRPRSGLPTRRCAGARCRPPQGALKQATEDARDRIRTCGLWLRRPTLYPAELHAQTRTRLLASLGPLGKRIHPCPLRWLGRITRESIPAECRTVRRLTAVIASHAGRCCHAVDADNRRKLHHIWPCRLGGLHARVGPRAGRSPRRRGARAGARLEPRVAARFGSVERCLDAVRPFDLERRSGPRGAVQDAEGRR